MRAAALLSLSFCLLLLAGCDDTPADIDGSVEEDASRPDTDGGRDSGPALCEGDGTCDDGRFCNGVESCESGACASGSDPCGAGEVCDEDGDRCDAVMPPADGLPVGIPTPTYGWELDTSAPATLIVDNTDPDCSDTGPGDEATPLCDLFRGGRQATLEAGTVVAVRGGPYAVDGDYTVTASGTDAAPVILRGEGDARVRFDGEGERADFNWEGSYLVVEHLDFFHMTRHRLLADHLLFRDNAVHNPVDAFIDFNPVVGVTGHEVLIERCEIFNNRRDSDLDSHGIQASEGSFNVWILDNELYNNNGDSFQSCHGCFDTPPHHIYLGRNLLHEDRENGIDLKTVHDVVISENVLFGYGGSGTSSGDAMVIGSTGFDEGRNQGPRRIWVLHNDLSNSTTGIRVEGSEDVWLIGNLFRDLGTGLQIDNKPHRNIVVASNTMRGITTDAMRAFGCRPAQLVVQNNLLMGVGERHMDFDACGGDVLTLSNNFFEASANVRTDAGRRMSAAELDADSFASMHLEGDPQVDAMHVPGGGSPLIDQGADLSALYTAFNVAFSGDIAVDRVGTPRPSGAGEDIGAIERP
ncbi:MAG: right-handed parallel beta-helix repeat-containing protein [Sandaracinaceae bacterium]